MTLYSSYLVGTYHYYHVMIFYNIIICISFINTVNCSPLSKPYIAFRTDPYDQNIICHHELNFDSNNDNNNNIIQQHRPYLYDEVPNIDKCPIQLTLGIAKQHDTIFVSKSNTKPIIQSIYPSKIGKQILTTSTYEHFNILTPAMVDISNSNSNNYELEALVQVPEYPLLLESSIFHTSPILHDCNGDGIMDVILSDYDGGISILGLDMHSNVNNNKRYTHHTQIPRLYVRREWVERIIEQEIDKLYPDSRDTAVVEDSDSNNITKTTSESSINDPFHTYFEYSYDHNYKDLIRGESANILEQHHEHVQAVQERKAAGSQKQKNRRLQVVEEQIRDDIPNHIADNLGDTNQYDNKLSPEEHEEFEQQGYKQFPQQDDMVAQPDDNTLTDDLDIPELDEMDRGTDDLAMPMDDMMLGSDMEAEIYNEQEDAREAEEMEEDPGGGMYDDYYENRGDLYHDDYAYGRYHYEDDMYYDGYNQEHSEYYDTKHYIRIPPHILTDPVLVEVPKMYGNTDDKDDILLIPVSYYLDEDEYEGFFSYKRFDVKDSGDETEVKRGMFVANAIMGYILGDNSHRWVGQTHLDLSTDYTAPENATIVGTIPVRSDTTQMSALALSTPTVADLDADGNPEVIIGTSMGLIYAFDARQMFKRDKWPVQLKRPIEQRILVEDVIGDTNLEIFVTDIGGTVVCLNHNAEIIWHKNWLVALKITDDNEEMNTRQQHNMIASSPMSLGDINGDGKIDLVQVIYVRDRTFVFAVTASTGEILPRFPIELDDKPANVPIEADIHYKLPQPLLVDLHITDVSYINAYIRRNGTEWKQQQPKPYTKPAPHGGTGPGLHIVQPNGESVFIIEAYTGCTQKITIGEAVSNMVQVDDVHGTNKLDLVIMTDSGKIITLESQTPYHPLNTWTGGSTRGHRGNLHTHGYTASQGIYVHTSSRQFRDVFGVYVHITFEIFDNRPKSRFNLEHQKYNVEIRDGPSWKRVLFRKQYLTPGIYTEQVYIRYGPGYYNIYVTMTTSHGIIYEDMFNIGYNVGFMDGFGILLWLPLLLSAITIFLCGTKKSNWQDDDEDYIDNGRDGHNLGILGRALPT